VGYQIRFERVESAQTRIKFVTKALLLRQMASDPELKGVGAVVFDEFHERNLHSDVALALARRLQETHRPDLLIMAMSATLDTEGVAQWLGLGRVPWPPTDGAPSRPGAEYTHLPRNSTRPIWDAAAEQVRRALARGSEGERARSSCPDPTRSCGRSGPARVTCPSPEASRSRRSTASSRPKNRTGPSSRAPAAG
jgi:ATP-dependent helicase HrpB